MQNVVDVVRTSGVSPKVVASLVTGLIVFALSKLAIPLDPIIEQFINVLAMAAAGYLAPPGKVVVTEPEYDPGAGDVAIPPDASVA